MRSLLPTLFFFATLFINAQTTYTYTGTGDWTDQGNWSPNYPGTTISSLDEVIIDTGADVELIVVTINGTLTNRGTLESRSTFRNNGTIINESTITNKSFFYNEGVITNDGQWNNNSIFINNSILNNNGTFTNNAFLYGNNTSHTNDFDLSQLFSPGNNSSTTGTYIFDNNLTFLSSANMTSDIRSTSEIDLVQVASTATLSGTLNVNLLDSYDPAIGTSYTILTASNVNGTFDTTNFPTLIGNKTFEISYTPTTVVLTVVRTPFIYTGTGNWTDQGNWSPSYPGTTISSLDEVIIDTGADVELIVVTINGTLTNRGTLESRSTFRNNGTIINESTITNKSFFYNEGVITNDGQWSNNSIFINNSILNNNGTFTNNAFLYGNNTSHTNDFDLSQLFSPGSSTPSIGTYIFDNNVTFQSSANMTSDIRSISEVDLAQVSGTAILSGTLNLNLLDSYDPAIGTTYTILTANNVSGTFDTTNFPDLGTDKEFQITYNLNSIIVEVVDSRLLNIDDLDLDTDQIKIVMHPNPTTDIINIDGLRIPQKVTVYSILGVKLQESIVSPNDNKVLVNDLNRGTYLLSVGKDNYKFVKN